MAKVLSYHALQYLRARYYNAANGRFNRLDPFAGNINDPQSLHKYLYTHADPVNGIDPSGELRLASALTALGVIGTLAGLGPAVARFGVGWGAQTTNNAQRIAIVDGIGFLEKWTFSYGNGISLSAYASQLENAGHIVTTSWHPTEADLVNILNTNDIVIVVGHGPEDGFDNNRKPIGAINLGGTSTHANENNVFNSLLGAPGNRIGAMAPDWVTANELRGLVNNPNLIFVAAGCRTARTSALSDAIGANTFVGCSGDANSANVSHQLEYVIDYLNEGPEIASQKFLAKSKKSVINPKNIRFPN